MAIFRNLTAAETATILTALRNFQEDPTGHELEPEDVLSSEEIDELCETIRNDGLTIDETPEVTH